MENKISNENYLENIYFETIIKQRVIIQAKYLNNKINNYLIQYLKKKFEGKCISEGYIQHDTIEIINKSIGALNGSRFTGDISYEVLFKAKICNPLVNNIIECQVKFINKLGLLCNNGPITIIVGRQFHNNQKLLDQINIDDIIKVSIIDKKFSLNDNRIEVTARLSDDIINNSTQQNLVLGDITELDDEYDDILNIESSSINNNSDIDEIDEDINDLDSLDEFDFDEDFNQSDNEEDKNSFLNQINDEEIDNNDNDNDNDNNDNNEEELEEDEY
jgi:DNA-directed RNA polymerase subunit E'/Rpb7